jgi:hypothetical protein
VRSLCLAIFLVVSTCSSATSIAQSERSLYALANPNVTFQQNLLDEHYCQAAVSNTIYDPSAIYEQCMLERGHTIYKNGGLIKPEITEDRRKAAVICQQAYGSAGMLFDRCMDGVRRGLSGEMAREEAAEQFLLQRTLRNAKGLPPPSTPHPPPPAPPGVTIPAQRPPAGSSPLPQVPRAPASESSFFEVGWEVGKESAKDCAMVKVIVWSENLGNCLGVHWVAGMAWRYAKEYVHEQVCHHQDQYDTEVVKLVC